MPKTISQIHADWKNAKAKYAVFIKYNKIAFDQNLGDALDKAVAARPGSDWKKTYDAEQKASKIATAYHSKVKNYSQGGGKVVGSVPKEAGDEAQKGLLHALYDVQVGLGQDMQYVKHLYLK